EANEGIFEPLLLEPHPDHPGKFRIVDGDRRWTNSKNLVENQKKSQYRRLPAEITDRTLTEEERLRVWIYIHRQRREWDTKEKEKEKEIQNPKRIGKLGKILKDPVGSRNFCLRSELLRQLSRKSDLRPRRRCRVYSEILSSSRTRLSTTLGPHWQS